MFQSTVKHNRLKIIFRILTPFLVVLVLLPVAFMSKTNSEADGEIAISFEGGKKQYHDTMNCFFNLAVRYQIKAYNEQYKKDIGKISSALLPVPDIGNCDALIGKIPAYKNFFDYLFEKKGLQTNKENLSKGMMPPTTEQVIPCGTNYLFREQQIAISPTYAVAVVGNCYYETYKQYLAVDSSTFRNSGTTKTAESLLAEMQERNEENNMEANKALDIFELALASLDEFIQTYPLHVQYEAIIVQSQKVRDQFKKLRAAIDQLQYKSINQSYQSD